MKTVVLALVAALLPWKSHAADSKAYLLICEDGSHAYYIALMDKAYVLFDKGGISIASGTLVLLDQRNLLGAEYGDLRLLLGTGEAREYAMYLSNTRTKVDVYLECR